MFHSLPFALFAHDQEADNYEDKGNETDEAEYAVDYNTFSLALTLHNFCQIRIRFMVISIQGFWGKEPLFGRRIGVKCYKISNDGVIT